MTPVQCAHPLCTRPVSKSELRVKYGTCKHAIHHPCFHAITLLNINSCPICDTHSRAIIIKWLTDDLHMHVGSIDSAFNKTTIEATESPQASSIVAFGRNDVLSASNLNLPFENSILSSGDEIGSNVINPTVVQRFRHTIARTGKPQLREGLLLNAGSRTLKDLIRQSKNLDDIQRDGYTFQDLVTSGIDVNTLLNKGYTIAEIISFPGCSFDMLVRADIAGAILCSDMSYANKILCSLAKGPIFMDQHKFYLHIADQSVFDFIKKCKLSSEFLITLKCDVHTLNRVWKLTGDELSVFAYMNKTEFMESFNIKTNPAVGSELHNLFIRMKWIEMETPKKYSETQNQFRDIPTISPYRVPSSYKHRDYDDDTDSSDDDASWTRS